MLHRQGYKHLQYIVKHDAAKKVEQIDYKKPASKNEEAEEILSSGREQSKKKKCEQSS